jgi:hypothetical protein
MPKRLHYCVRADEKWYGMYFAAKTGMCAFDKEEFIDCVLMKGWVSVVMRLGWRKIVIY